MAGSCVLACVPKTPLGSKVAPVLVDGRSVNQRAILMPIARFVLLQEVPA